MSEKVLGERVREGVHSTAPVAIVSLLGGVSTLQAINHQLLALDSTTRKGLAATLGNVNRLLADLLVAEQIQVYHATRASCP